ncbi:hypothetical protein OAR92_01330 [Porticoccaceae bacterium]|nr:hypothetical protein [Porticoccaceae bacterium]
MKIQLPTLSILETYKVSKIVLESTPESWLEFSAGQNTKTNLVRFKSNKYLSFCKQLLGYLYFLFKSFCFTHNLVQQRDVLFFASTYNQFSVLSDIYLEKTDFSSIFFLPNIVRSRLDAKEVDPYYLKINIKYLFPMFILLGSRFFLLISTLREKDNRLVFLRLKSFLLIYYWLVSHQVCLKSTSPKIVMLSNDHSPETRTMIELCKYFDIKTAYVPHAAVSERFHSLDFNYSFLDGQNALDIYRKCDARRSPNSTVLDKRAYFLVGNLRKLNIESTSNKLPEKFGLAIKGTDRIEDIINIVTRLSALGPVVVRPHPNLNVSKYTQIIDQRFPNNVELSDPKLLPVSAFLNVITTLISGNSTLILEAASLGIHSIYLNELSGGVPDYYGFVNRKIAIYFENIDDFIDFYVEHDFGCEFFPDREGMNYYWSSYKRPYFNQEAKIIADYLSQIVKNSLKLESCHEITNGVM